MRQSRPSVAWLVLAGLLFSLQAPLVAQLRPAPGTLPVALCTSEGLRIVAVGAGDEAPASDHTNIAHCPLCVAPHDAPSTSRAPVGPVVAATKDVPTGHPHAVVAPAAVILARVRAQPPPVQLLS